MFLKEALTVFTFTCMAVNRQNSGCVCICVAMVILEPECVYTAQVSCERYEHGCVTVSGGENVEIKRQTDRQGQRVYAQIRVHNMCFPPAGPTHVSSVVRASAALPSPWMDSMAVE